MSKSKDYISPTLRQQYEEQITNLLSTQRKLYDDIARRDAEIVALEQSLAETWSRLVELGEVAPLSDPDPSGES